MDKLERILELPCIKVNKNDKTAIISFTSRQVVTLESLAEDPVFMMRHLTLELQSKCRKSFEDKHAVLNEIERGTNRYKIVGGNFEDIGI